MTLRWHAPDDTTGPISHSLEGLLAEAFTGGDRTQLNNGLRMWEPAYWLCVGARYATADPVLSTEADALALAIDKHGYGAIALRRDET